MNHIQRGRDMADTIAKDASHRPQTVIVASHSAADFPNVVAAGFANISFEEYNQRLSGLIANMEQRGITVVTVPATAQQIIDKLAEAELPDTPDGHAAAVGLIYQTRSPPLAEDFQNVSEFDA